ncbi:hypothetical protein F0562_018766 [Nyssa sinensis]|uniref:Uncharacterized protein n=1 Tax=Nyssa sinensis TaxID=561372 RepID=A0A5J4ZA09_9ASTE|nr:hypothetical protein F0562_018766 [Nyssa sinensis]
MILSCLNQHAFNLYILEFELKYSELLPMINRAFAKLVMEIDHPMSKWEIATIEEYFNYSLNLLELLNSISSSLSHLCQARLSLSHALSILETSSSLAIERLKPIHRENFRNHFKEGKKETEERSCSGNESVIQQAVIVMRSIGFWVCGIVLSGLCSDVEPYMEMSKSAGEFVNSLLSSIVCEEIVVKNGVLKEVEEINGAVAHLVAAAGAATGESGSNAAKELERRLEEIEKLLEVVGKDTNHLFSEVLAGRNELLDCLRQQKQ